MKAEQEPEPREPGGRNTRKPGEMDSDSIAAAYGHAARLRSHEVAYQLDLWLGKWMTDARDVLAKRGHLEPGESGPERVFPRWPGGAGRLRSDRARSGPRIWATTARGSDRPPRDPTPGQTSRVA